MNEEDRGLMHEGDRATTIRFIDSAYDDEPLFIIRGRDALAIPVLRAYVDECLKHGLNGQADRANGHHNRFIDWQRENAKLTHLPDPLPARAVPEPVWVCDVCGNVKGRDYDESKGTCDVGPFVLQEGAVNS